MGGGNSESEVIPFAQAKRTSTSNDAELLGQ
jgi:hypothetical protein